MVLKFLYIIIAFVAFFITPLRADDGYERRVNKYTTPKGCHLFFYGPGDTQDAKFDRLEWSGSCFKGHPISGKGNLKIILLDRSSGRDKVTSDYQGISEYSSAFDGVLIKNGFLTGTAKKNFFEQTPFTVKFQNGCEYEVDKEENERCEKAFSSYVVKAVTSKSPVGSVVDKSTLGECVSLVNPKRITKINKFDTDKGHSETQNDALNLTLKNICNSDQIVGLIIKYKTTPLNTGEFAHLQLPESPYFDINSEQQRLGLIDGYVQTPFAGTISNPYAYQFVPKQPSESQYHWGKLLPANAESKGMFVVPHGDVSDSYDPRTQTLEYYVASCPHKKGDVVQGMFWDPARRYLACSGWVPVKVLK